MTEKEFTCVVCPNGCSITVKYNEGDPPHIIDVTGYSCPRGKKWVMQEMENPLRTFSSSVLVENGNFLEASVRLTKPIPLTKVFDVMAEIRKIKLKAPLKIGDVILKDPAGTATDVIVTRNIKLKQ